jgi:hypothetical protein
MFFDVSEEPIAEHYRVIFPSRWKQEALADVAKFLTGQVT